MCSENDGSRPPQSDEQGLGINARRKKTIQLTVGHNLTRGTRSYFAGSIFVTTTVLVLPSTRPVILTFWPASSRAFC